VLDNQNPFRVQQAPIGNLWTSKGKAKPQTERKGGEYTSQSALEIPHQERGSGTDSNRNHQRTSKRNPLKKSRITPQRYIALTEPILIPKRNRVNTKENPMTTRNNDATAQDTMHLLSNQSPSAPPKAKRMTHFRKMRQ
jgi:hypothetical protein